MTPEERAELVERVAQNPMWGGSLEVRRERAAPAVDALAPELEAGLRHLRNEADAARREASVGLSDRGEAQ